MFCIVADVMLVNMDSFFHGTKSPLVLSVRGIKVFYRRAYVNTPRDIFLMRVLV